MNEIQKGLLKLLLELDTICKKHNITYYLVGGSALGAVRHQGFLPWDDDADIVMTKENWEKLQKAFETDMPENRLCVGWHNYEEEPSVFFRYMDTTQTDIHISLWDRNMPWGGIVDIFVLNPLPVNPLEWNRYHKIMRRFGEYVMGSYILCSADSTPLSYLQDCFIGKIKGPSYVKERLYSELSRYDESSCTHFSYLYARIHLVYKKEIFQEPRYVPFEGHLLPIPTLAEEHFRILFGDDWYNIPSGENRISHVAQHDTKRSYKEYMYDYMHYANIGKVRKSSFRIKLMKLFREQIRRVRDKKIAILRSKYLLKLFEQYFENNRIKLNEYCQQNKYLELYRFFTPFYAELLMPIMQKHKIPILLDGHWLEMALRAQIAAGFNRKAERIINLYDGRKGTGSQSFDELKELLQKKNNLFIAHETMSESFKMMADEMFDLFPYDKDIRIMKLKATLAETHLSDDTLWALLEEGKIGEAQWPDAAEFKKVQADIYLRLNEKSKAYELFKQVKETTSNGMLLLEINSEQVYIENEDTSIMMMQNKEGGKND